MLLFNSFLHKLPTDIKYLDLIRIFRFLSFLCCHVSKLLVESEFKRDNFICKNIKYINSYYLIIFNSFHLDDLFK